MIEIAPLTLLAFDYGARRIGVAIGETLMRSARPLEVLQSRDGVPNWPSISRLVEQWSPDLFVVGLPVTDDGHEQPMAPAIRRFARRLHGRFGLRVSTIDERLSSHEALARGHWHDTDAVAAQLILETWMNEYLTGRLTP